MILVGELALWVAFLMATWAAVVSFAGGAAAGGRGRADLIASGERGVYATLGLVVLASLGLWTALLTHDFSLRYVASYTSANLPVAYTITSFWAGQAGSLLFWVLVLALYAAAAVWLNRRRNRAVMPYVTGTLAAVLVFFLAMLALGANPYERLDWIPPDGRGMNPQLQNPGMAIHPPMLYLGYVGTTVPFAFAVAALIARRFDGEWLTAVRKWVLFGWLFNSVGIVLGMWWAYVELGWGGYWAWDPVENASLLPWLVNTAFLHSIMVQEKRGMLRKWNVMLVISAFLLAIFGTFITRSGIISSVHSFAQSPVGKWFAGFLVLAIVLTAILVATRLRDLRAPAELDSMLSREAAFLYNNVILVAIAFSVLWGTLFPIISEAVRGEKITVGPPFFNAVNVPLGLTLLLLTGIGPLIAWRRASPANLRRQFVAPVGAGVLAALLCVAAGMRDAAATIAYALAAFVLGTVVQEFARGVRARQRMHGESPPVALAHLVARNRRRYGGYVVHVGVLLLFAAFAGLAFKTDHDVRLRTAESTTLRDPYGREWRFVSEGVSRYDALNRQVLAVTLATYRDGERVGLLSSEKRQHVDSRGVPTFEPSTEVGILGSPRQDVYVVLAGVTEEDTAELRISFNPLVWWVWVGGFVMAIGGLIVMWPQSQRRLALAARGARPESETPSQPTPELVEA